MPRNGVLTDEEKARAVLARTGSPGNHCAMLTPDELAELAAVYDACEKDAAPLKQLIGDFWGRRQERLADQKATDDVAPPSLFQNVPTPPAEA